MAYKTSSASLRHEIAVSAARMMAEEGIRDYGFAKRKAAKKLAARSPDLLPSNEEIEEELRIWLSLHRDEDHEARLHMMRRAAIDLMQHFSAFHPYLTGGALTGLINPFTEMEIELYPDSGKEVEIFCINMGLRFEYHEPGHAMTQPPESILTFDWQDVPVRLLIFDTPGGSPRRDKNERARLSAVQALLVPEQDMNNGCL